MCFTETTNSSPSPALTQQHVPWACRGMLGRAASCCQPCLCRLAVCGPPRRLPGSMAPLQQRPRLSLGWGLPSDWQTAAGSGFFHPQSRHGCAERCCFPEGHCSTGTAASSCALHPGGEGRCLAVLKLLSKAAATGCYQDVPRHGGSCIYGTATYRILRVRMVLSPFRQSADSF